MTKKILFPFSFDKDFRRGYSWTMELAVRINATLFFFTTIPTDSFQDDVSIHRISESLSQARRNYSLRPAKDLAQTERHIEKGDFTWSLMKFIKKNDFDFVVVDPMASEFSPATLREVVENANGVIVLPDPNPGQSPTTSQIGETEKLTEDFYDLLRQSELHKLPNNFFPSLGQDKNLFNYLRRFFRKNKY